MKFLDILSFLSSAGEFVLMLLIFAVVLGLIVGIHEFGHFIFARRGGILCREYAIGMGPVICKKKKGETTYSLRAIPLGGFCAIAGEEGEEDDPIKNKEYIKLNIQDGKVIGIYLEDENEEIAYPRYKIVKYDLFDKEETGNLFMTVENAEGIEETYDVDPKAMMYYKKDEMQIAPYNRTLNSKSLGRRAMVMFGGPLMNFLLAIVVFFIVGLCSGFADYDSNELGEVTEGTNVYELGLREGDQIIALSTASLGKVEISNWNELTDFLAEYRSGLYVDEYVEVTYKNKDDEIKTISVTPFIALNNAGFGSDYKYLTTGKVVVGVVEPLSDNLGDNSELKVNDEIIEISGNKVESWSDVIKAFDGYDSKEYIEMKVLRDGEEVSVKVLPYSNTLMENQTSLSGSQVASISIVLGISPSMKFDLFQSVGYAFTRTWDSLTAVFSTLYLLFSNTVSISNLSGPIGIFSLTSQAASYGALYVLSLIGLLSVNIGLLNLFPIPALDGGRLVFVAYEAITRKKPNPKVEKILISVTMILLLALMVFVAYADIVRLFK